MTANINIEVLFRLIIEYSVISMEETICIIYSSCLIRFPLILRLFHLRGTSTNPHCQSQINDIKEIKDILKHVRT